MLIIRLYTKCVYHTKGGENMKLDDKQIKAACMMIDLGEFTRIEIAKQFGISKSYLDKLYRERNEKNKDSVNEKNILDNKEVRLVNKTFAHYRVIVPKLFYNLLKQFPGFQLYFSIPRFPALEFYLPV